MKLSNFIFVFVIFSFFCFENFPQSFIVKIQQQSLSDSLGREVYFRGLITNNLNDSLSLCLIRTKNILPNGWISSICFNNNCFTPQFDSVATTTDFGIKPIPPLSSMPVGLHVFMYNNHGISTVEYTFKNLKNLNDFQIVTLNASTIPLRIKNYSSLDINNFKLFQNYPNPMNPSTKISWQLPIRSYVTLKVFDVLGNEVTTLVDEEKDAGSYEVEFSLKEKGNPDAHKIEKQTIKSFSSGIYLYRLQAGNYNETKKMIFLK